MRTLQPIDYQSGTVVHFTTNENALGLYEGVPQSPLTATHDLSPSQILPALTSLHSIQNSLDTAKDTADLRQVMRAALQTTSDAEMLEVLQVGHHEMPDAIKTLQRALEHITERDDDGVEAPPGNGVAIVKVNFKEVEEPGRPPKRSRTIYSTDSSSTSSSGHSLERMRDTLDREFIESGIDCLRRMSRGNETTLPSWTITK
jgi:abelson tyrosine-protein kinase 1